jgi:hypothetical protein
MPFGRDPPVVVPATVPRHGRRPLAQSPDWPPSNLLYLPHDLPHDLPPLPRARGLQYDSVVDHGQTRMQRVQREMDALDRTVRARLGLAPEVEDGHGKSRPQHAMSRVPQTKMSGVHMTQRQTVPKPVLRHVGTVDSQEHKTHQRRLQLQPTGFGCSTFYSKDACAGRKMFSKQREPRISHHVRTFASFHEAVMAAQCRVMEKIRRGPWGEDEEEEENEPLKDGSQHSPGSAPKKATRITMDDLDPVPGWHFLRTLRGS